VTVEVVIPFAGSCPHRLRALDWVRGRYPWPVTVAHGGWPWSKGAAVMPDVSSSCADVVVVADADVWTDGIHAAVSEVRAGAPWAIPHRGVFRLTEASTARALAGEQWEDLETTERPYLGVEGGGIVVIHRALLLNVPLDPRFEGWGQEDESWAIALRTTLGAPWRGKAPLAHLYHPPQPRLSRARGSDAGWRLRRRYLKAQRDPAAMLALLEEARDHLQARQQALHDHAA
jgi:hypothetical protein